MDIVYPVKKTALNEELIYSLRSLCNIPHNQVFIVGDLPDFINTEKVIYIESNILNSRYETTTNNIKLACLDKNLSNDFILMNDDFFILNTITEKDLLLNRGYLKHQVDYYHKYHKPLTNFDRLIEQALIQLKQFGFKNPISFELHCPMIINKYNYLSMLNKINSDALHCCKRSLYGNYFIKESKTIDDVKILSNHIFKEDNQGKLPFISCSECCFNKVKAFLIKKFPQKSMYEK